MSATTRYWSLVLAVAVASNLAVAATPLLAGRATAVGPSVVASAATNRVNAIRVSLGLRTARETTAYDAYVIGGLQRNTDPAFIPLSPSVEGERSLWGVVPGWMGTNAQGAISVVNDWVYHDGWKGSIANTLNVGCTSMLAMDCNGHRRAILSRPPRPGAILYIDIVARPVSYDGTRSIAVAALLVWKAPPKASRAAH